MSERVSFSLIRESRSVVQKFVGKFFPGTKKPPIDLSTGGWFSFLFSFLWFVEFLRTEAEEEFGELDDWPGSANGHLLEFVVQRLPGNKLHGVGAGVPIPEGWRSLHEQQNIGVVLVEALHIGELHKG